MVAVVLGETAAAARLERVVEEEAGRAISAVPVAASTAIKLAPAVVLVSATEAPTAGLLATALAAAEAAESVTGSSEEAVAMDASAGVGAGVAGREEAVGAEVVVAKATEGGNRRDSGHARPGARAPCSVAPSSSCIPASPRKGNRTCR